MHSEALRLLDGQLFLVVNRIDAPAWEWAMGWGTDLGHGLALALLLLAGLRVFDPRRFPKNFLVLGLAALLAGLAVNVIKQAAPRNRPLTSPVFQIAKPSGRAASLRLLPGGLSVREWAIGDPRLAEVAPRLKVIGPVLKYRSPRSLK